MGNYVGVSDICQIKAFNKVNDNQIINILNIDLSKEKLNLYCPK